ncbi:MAG: hypothetical protein JWQ89_23 [Devosia sp.]|uniref:hypothetical protein n=1 Tax=Devosia sp. TaxID=1871048 RepID=UPI002622DC6B|nr:hypothetical protein [Devosia sp.]MDB5538296.1 hypothetical protein [Devosia sp.]
MDTHTLIEHRDIQNWVKARMGQPAIRRVPDPTGRIRARLALNFARKEAPTETPSQDDGMSPCSWTAWLAELDRQNLALRVSDKAAFEFVERRGMN